VTLAFIPARMTSRRFPGKVLAPFRGEPLIRHAIRLGRDAVGADHVVVLTSSDPTDDPLAAYVAGLGTRVFRGPLDDVFARFRACAVELRPDWILRINADSPLMSGRIVRAVLERTDGPYDLVTTIAPRTLPRGQNPEAIRASALLAVDRADLTDADREHVTPYFHRHTGRYRVRNVATTRGDLAQINLSVDTVEDLRRLESLPEAETEALIPESLD